MTVAVAPQSNDPGLYPPTVRGPDRPLPLRRFLFRFVRNPLLSLPQNVYEDGIVVFDSGMPLRVWPRTWTDQGADKLGEPDR